jgi:hypothetical protein
MIERRRGFSTENKAEAAIEIVEAKIHHCGLMGRRMRKVHRNILESGGLSPYRELMLMFGQSSFCRSAFFDGRIVAMGGITGSILATHSVAWLVLAEEFRNRPVTIVQHARRFLKQQMQTRSALAATILLEDDAALRFAVYLGFHVFRDDDGDGAPATNHRSRARLAHYVKSKRDIHIRVGPISVIPLAMGVH